MVVLLTITAGLDTGPFDIYSNATGTFVIVETGISKAQLVAGYTCSIMPDGTTVVRVKSVGTCTNFVDATITYPTPTPTPSQTPNSTPSPTPTRTPTPTPNPSSHMHLGTANNYPTVLQACGQASSRPYYSITPAFYNGIRVYDDVGCTIPFVGAGLGHYYFIQVQESGSTYRAYEIGATGYILTTTDCP